MTSRPRQPVSRNAKGLIAVSLVFVFPFVIYLITGSYILGLSALFILATGYVVYFLGMSSGLPGTSGKNGRNVRT